LEIDALTGVGSGFRARLRPVIEKLRRQCRVFIEELDERRTRRVVHRIGIFETLADVDLHARAVRAELDRLARGRDVRSTGLRDGALAALHAAVARRELFVGTLVASVVLDVVVAGSRGSGVLARAARRETHYESHADSPCCGTQAES